MVKVRGTSVSSLGPLGEQLLEWTEDDVSPLKRRKNRNSTVQWVTSLFLSRHF